MSKSYGVGVNDLPRGSCYHIKNGTKKPLKFYRDWNNMLRRCYRDGKTYSSCSVSDDWLILSNFKSWHDKNYVEGWELDKDLLLDGSKVYSADSCSYVPKDVNLMFCNSQAKRGEFEQGVSMCTTTGMYRCRTKENNKDVWIGRFLTEDAAVKAYKVAKLPIMLRRLEKYKDQISSNLYSAIKTKIEKMYAV